MANAMNQRMMNNNQHIMATTEIDHGNARESHPILSDKLSFKHS